MLRVRECQSSSQTTGLPKGVDHASRLLKQGPHSAEPLSIVPEDGVNANLLLQRAVVCWQEVVPAASKQASQPPQYLYTWGKRRINYASLLSINFCDVLKLRSLELHHGMSASVLSCVQLSHQAVKGIVEGDAHMYFSL